VISLTGKVSKTFYGWWIVGACFLISLYLGGAVVLGFTAFFEPIANEFGWSYAQISLAASLRGAEVGLLAPLTGFLADRWGSRRLMFGGTVLVGLALIFVSGVTSLGMFYGTFALIAIGTSGLSPTVMITPLGNWFRRKLGLATGIMSCGFALGGLLVPIVVKLIDAYDWRTALFILGVGTWVIGVPLSLIVRHRPEQYGYLPDGDQDNTALLRGGLVPGQTHAVNIWVMGALKSHVFWHVSLAMMLVILAISAVIVHVMPYLSSVGIARSTSSIVAMAVALLSIVGRLASGWLADRFNKARAATWFFAIMGLGLLFFSFASNERIWPLIPFIILFGIGWGCNFPIRAALLRQHFGRSNFGTVFGYSMGMTALGAIVGPFLAGWVFDNWGSYHAAWLLFTGLIFVAAVVMATMPTAITNIQQDNDE
jgi:sugar phosphate permease